MYLDQIRAACRRRMETRSLRTITQPELDPISLDEARLHLRVDAYQNNGMIEHPDDPWIVDAIAASREWCETENGRSFAPQVFELQIDGFPHGVIALPMPPVRQIISFTYLDSAGAEHDVDGYLVDLHSEPARVAPPVGGCWPQTTYPLSAVRIRFIAGYDTAADSPLVNPIPQSYVIAMKLVLSHLYEHREDNVETVLHEMPLGARAFLGRNRVRLGMA